ncbi:MAG: hypothetical protein K2Y23_12275 [Cyanobacteria bacterium]|nr:hypothetical protein [Cyanobacteriota bacterium]
MFAITPRASFMAALVALFFAGCNSDSPTTPTPTSPPVPPAVIVGPEILSLSPSSAAAGSTVTVTLTGNHFVSGATTAELSGNGVSLSEVNVSATSITARVSIDAAATPGPRTLTILTNRGGATATFSVTPNPAGPVPTPSSFTITPATGLRGTTVNVTLNSSASIPGSTTIAISGGGVSIGNISGPGAVGAPVTATFVINADATPGDRTVTLTTPFGTSNAIFTVNAVPPVIGSFSATPGIIASGGSSTLRWTGIAGATTCSINNGVGGVPCADGSVVVAPTSTTEYQLMTVGPGGREWKYVTVVVESGVIFNFTGAAQGFTVPAGVTSITVTAFGAQGGAGAGGGPAGGLGGSVQARITVTPGEVLTINVGGAGVAAGAGGFNGGGASGAAVSRGGGGGGASDVRRGGVGLANRVVVAGGGGGSGTLAGGGAGGAGGGLVGANGAAGSGSAGNDGNGGGGTQAAGGTGGAGGPGTDGAAGASGQGGAGGFGVESGGGAGGGFFGGGGGEESNAGVGTGGGGGGGSSFTTGSATNVVHAQGVRAGNGQIIIIW